MDITIFLYEWEKLITKELKKNTTGYSKKIRGMFDEFCTTTGYNRYYASSIFLKEGKSTGIYELRDKRIKFVSAKKKKYERSRTL